MSATSWQSLVVVICVALATAYLTWRIVRSVHSPHASGCDGCDRGNQTGIKQKPLISIDQLSQSAAHRERPPVDHTT
jgi:hypothetical protein